ncbi:MAG: FAD:protein FMN transferase [Luteolibacter sp.]|jgi:FAD:protein FMN transferase
MIRCSLVLAALIAFWMAGCKSGDRTHVATGEAMGTTYRIKTVQKADSAMPTIHAMLDRLDRELSTWRSDSWVAEFNAAPAGTTMIMPDAVLDLLERSREYQAETEGRFDPTIGALIRVWGFGAWKRDWAGEPTEQAVAAAREASGFGNLQIEGGRITKLHDGLMLDFSAIAKGHAVDLMAAILRDAGCTDFIIEFGGDILAHGNRPGGSGWTVGGPALDEPVSLHNEAMATSGSEFNFRGGQSHVIDPNRGQPVPVGRPVFVVAPTCAKADALATSMMVAEAEADGQLSK